MKNNKMVKKIRKLVLCALILFTVSSTKVLATSVPVVKRLEGKNRVETSIAVSKEAFKGKVKAVIIVGYDGEVDALI